MKARIQNDGRGESPFGKLVSMRRRSICWFHPMRVNRSADKDRPTRTSRLAHYERELYVVCQPDRAAKSILSRQPRADLVGGQPSPARGGRQHDRSGDTVIVAFQDKRDRVGLDFAHLLKSIPGHVLHRKLKTFGLSPSSDRLNVIEIAHH
ncbi:hypothetical protein [Bradyrhizobium sp. Mp27]|uniref:hypothetical protein n=1 Tax=Bradyrhizobium sp. Mp27 TaxID=3042157 RepID=UPI00248C544B|nr:hypothetical protein [Bradyrhizobium sp. Mp27]MDI2071006.1 hypothetical protein [Bradyrhizobium sp. Mp27]